MTKRAENFLEKENRLAGQYADFVLRFRWPIIVGLLTVTVLATTQVRHLDIRNDPNNLLPATNRYVATNQYVERHFAMGNFVAFALRVKQGDIYQPWFEFRNTSNRALVAVLREDLDAETAPGKVKQVLFSPETDFYRKWAPARDAYWREYAAAVAEISDWVAKHHRQNVIAKLQRYAQIASRLNKQS